MNELSQLRNNIDFASISQFLHTFQSAFGPWTSQADYSRSTELNDRFETEDLESMFLQASDRSRLEDMIIRMLRILTHNRFVNYSNWQTYFSKEFDKRELEEENPLVTIEKIVHVKKEKTADTKPEDIKTDQDAEMTERLMIEEEEEEEEEKEEEVVEEKIVPVNYFTLTLDIRIHLIYLLCEWQLDEPDKLREHLETEDDCVQWRVEPIGFDKRGDIFWLFDDNRLYKESLTKPRPKKKAAAKKRKTTKGSRKSSRNAKQQDDQVAPVATEEEEEEEEWKPWRLLCATSNEWEHIAEKFAQSTHVDEKQFYDLLVNHVVPKVLPVLLEHEKDIKMREAIIHRKRSSRIMFKEIEARERAYSMEVEEEEKLPSRTALKEEKEREQLQKAREERLLEREKRTMEREYRRLARERKEEGENNGENSDRVQDNQLENTSTIPPLKLIVKDKSNANTQGKKKRGRKPKARNADPGEESWEFDCICGVKGENLDDGSPMIACERCGVWQHIKCLRKYGQVHANKKTLDSITFVCRSCKIKNGEDVEPIRPVKRQKTKKLQQQQENDQVILPSIQTWDRLQSPQITIISSQPPLQSQVMRPVLQAPLPQPTIQTSHPILHPIIEPRPGIQPAAPVLEPQPSTLEPSSSSSFSSHPPPILPQPILPPLSQQSLPQNSPTPQQPFIQQPFIQQPILQKALSEQPSIPRQSLTQQPTFQQPSIQQPILQKALSEQPLTQQPILQKALAEQPAIPQQPLTQQPTSQQPIPQKALSEQPAIHQQPLTQQSIPENILSEQTLTQQPILQKAFAEQPAIPQQPLTEQPTSQQPSIEQSIPQQPLSQQHVPQQSFTEQPAIQQPVPQKPALQRPSIQQLSPPTQQVAIQQPLPPTQPNNTLPQPSPQTSSESPIQTIPEQKPSTEEESKVTLPKHQPDTNALEAQSESNVTPTQQSANVTEKDVTLEDQEKLPNVPLSN